MPKTLRLILGDQLNLNHSWFTVPDESVTFLLLEMRQETDYVAHHIQKVVAFFLAMRDFASELEAKGHQVLYFRLDDEQNSGGLDQMIPKLIQNLSFERFEYLLPDEYRLDLQLKSLCQNLNIATGTADTEHFLTSRVFLSEFFAGKKGFLMETFYREMRRKFDVLMDGKEPKQGQWNFDHENRATLKDKNLLKKPLTHPK
jgi:deoxyribodipyrimidine photolyase-related protein